MDRCRRRTSVAFATLVVLCFVAAAPAPDTETDARQPSLPVVTFFFYDAGDVEWAVSAEPERFQRHLASNSDSQALFDAVSEAVVETPDPAGPARQMTRWINEERERFDESRREPARMRMAEGIIAYLRDHDFGITKLVDELKHRSGASEVELVVIHQRDAEDASSYKLKVVLVDPDIEIGKQGFNVNLPEPKATYTVVAYALGVALYEVQEIIHRDSSEEGTEENPSVEPLPLPEPLETPATDAVPARLRRAQSN